MLRSKRLLTLTSRIFLHGEEKLLPVIPRYSHSQWISTRFLDIYQMGNKEAIEKERARIKDEMSRGYFADMKEMKEHGGKLGTANKIIIPAVAAVKFPPLEVNYPDGSTCKLPLSSQGTDVSVAKNVPKVSLLCLSFRASSQSMVETWSSPFLKSFGNSSDIKLYEVSFIDSWLLTRSPIKKLLLKVLRKPQHGETQDVLQRQIVYSFGDHYYLRKELRIVNLLTGYIFLLDRLGRVRWQGSGLATEDELSSLVFCTSILMEEK